MSERRLDCMPDVLNAIKAAQAGDLWHIRMYNKTGFIQNKNNIIEELQLGDTW